MGVNAKKVAMTSALRDTVFITHCKSWYFSDESFQCLDITITHSARVYGDTNKKGSVEPLWVGNLSSSAAEEVIFRCCASKYHSTCDIHVYVVSRDDVNSLPSSLGNTALWTTSTFNPVTSAEATHVTNVPGSNLSDGTKQRMGRAVAQGLEWDGGK